MIYFAYGSNMLTARLQKRVASARPLGPARLGAHRLRFHKRSVDGSSKCDALVTGVPAHEVLGVLYEIAAAERPALDAAEGLGRGYRRREIVVEADGVGSARAFAYLAQGAHLAPELLPYDWYKLLVIAGAREHGLPASYIASIEQVRAQPDPDPARAGRHLSLLGPRPR